MSDNTKAHIIKSCAPVFQDTGNLSVALLNLIRAFFVVLTGFVKQLCRDIPLCERRFRFTPIKV